jgi:hypothetical protein
MTDLDTFRTVMQGPDQAEGRPAPLGEIITAGRRLRRRRRFATASLAVGLCAAVLGAGVAVQHNARHPAPAPAAGTSAYSPPGSWGAAVQTGIQQKAGQLVFTAIHYDSTAAPGVTFALRACWAQPDGTLKQCYDVSRYKPPARPSGFAVVSLPTRFVGEGDLPMFGYYDGPATKITVKSDGKQVVAQTAAWSEDPNVVFWWVGLDQVPIVQDSDANGKYNGKHHVFTDWSAYDAQGRRLPTGSIDTYQIS